MSDLGSQLNASSCTGRESITAIAMFSSLVARKLAGSSNCVSFLADPRPPALRSNLRHSLSEGSKESPRRPRMGRCIIDKTGQTTDEPRTKTLIHLQFMRENKTATETRTGEDGITQS